MKPRYFLNVAVIVGLFVGITVGGITTAVVDAL
jgi:hypothetical protein